MKGHYDTTMEGVMAWAKSELEHVGRIASLKDKDLQYSYAMSTLNGMAHLKDALYQMVGDKNYEWKKHELRKTHDSVIRVMKHLIKEYDLNLDTIKAFNTRHVLSNLSYLRNSTRKNSGKKSRTRKGRKSLL
jgi:hypothetical protein